MKSASSRRRAAQDELRERRLTDATALADRLVYDLARMTAGHSVDLESYVAPSVTGAVRAALRPFLASGDLLRPDFGAYGELRVEGDLLDPARAVVACLDFEDRSLLETSAGALRPLPRRRVRLWTRMALDSGRVEELRLTHRASVSRA